MRVFAIIILLLAPVGTANSKTFSSNIGDRTINLYVPDGYCVLTESDVGEKKLLEYLATANLGVNTVHIAFADCLQLKEWKQGIRQNIDSYGYMLSPSGPNLTEFSGAQDDLNREMGQTLGQQLESDIGQLLEEGERRAQSAMDKLEFGVQIEQTIPLGYFGYNSYGTYVGLVQKLRTAQGNEKTMLGMWSTITVQNRIMFFYLWDVYSGSVREVRELLELTKIYSRRQHEVN